MIIVSKEDYKGGIQIWNTLAGRFIIPPETEAPTTERLKHNNMMTKETEYETI